MAEKINNKFEKTTFFCRKVKSKMRVDRFLCAA